MNRNDLAKELRVGPWDVDSWLLLGCPAKKYRTEWEFELGKVKMWLKTEKIKIKKIKPQPHHVPTRFLLDQRWFGKRCPICMDRGIAGEKAGKVYTLGEVLEDGEWHLRRTGIPCGHSALLNHKEISNSSFRKGRGSMIKLKFKGTPPGFEKN